MKGHHKAIAGFPYGIAEGIGLRAHMEDGYAVYHFPEEEFFSAEVYDGHGGKNAALYAAEMLTPAFIDLWRREAEKTTGARRREADLLREAFLQTDRYVAGQVRDMGTTAALFYIVGNRFLAANAGDSRVVIGTGGGAYVLTVDHRPHIGGEKERVESLGGRIITFGVPRVEGILAVTRSLGDACLKPYVTAEPRIVEGSLGRENDRVVVACDGLWDVLEPDPTMELVRRSDLPQEGARAVLKTAVEAGGTDNITVLVVDLRPLTGTMKQQRMRIERVTDAAALPGP